MTILFESTQVIATSTSCVFFVIGFFLPLLIMLLLFALTYHGLDNIIALSLLIFTIMCFVVGLICAKPHRKIKAIISNEYSAVELYDKYDVIEREGDIWTLVEKEPISNGG